MQIAGISLIIYGGLSLFKITKLKTFLPNDHLSDTIPSIVVCIGVFIFLISFFGCCGAFQSNICLLDTYSICLTTLVLLQLILACFIFLFIEDIEKDAVRTFSKMWRSRVSSRDSRTMVSMVQEHLKCCGSNDMSDYNMPNTIPKSCCSLDNKLCDKENSYRIGCKMRLQYLLKSSAQVISYLCIGTAIVELMGAIMGFILSGYVRKLKQFRRCCR